MVVPDRQYLQTNSGMLVVDGGHRLAALALLDGNVLELSQEEYAAQICLLPSFDWPEVLVLPHRVPNRDGMRSPKAEQPRRNFAYRPKAHLSSPTSQRLPLRI